MVKQTVHLFIRALIIGVLLNVGLQQVSNTPLSQTKTIAPQQIKHPLSQSQPNPEIDFSDQGDNN
jgi:hypothetical protein